MYIMKRTQIYLDEAQARLLDQRAKATNRTRSRLIREAIDSYLNGSTGADGDLAAYRRAVEVAFNSAPDLPPGPEYVEQLRAGDLAREAELERRRRD